MTVPFTETIAWAALSWEENLKEDIKKKSLIDAKQNMRSFFYTNNVTPQTK